MDGKKIKVGGDDVPLPQSSSPTTVPTAAQRHAPSSRAPQTPSETGPWKPTLFFFYGSLMSQNLVQGILDLEEKPVLRPAYIRGFKAFKWSSYPTLIQSEEYKDNIVKGLVYEVKTKDHFQKLQYYETKCYTWCVVDISLEDTAKIESGRVFIWSGEPDSADIKEFEDGEFEEKFYKKFVVQGTK